LSTIDRLLRQLAREDVLECAVATGRFPAFRVGTGWTAHADVALSSDEIRAALARFGGGRHVETLGEAAVQWSFRVPQLGVVTVSATRRAEDLRARFTLSKRECEPVRAPEPESAPETLELEPTRLSGGGASPAPATSPVAPSVVTAATTRTRSRSASGDGLPSFLEDAREAGATDLHIVAGRPVLRRIGGALIPDGDPIAPERVEQLLLAIVPARLHAELERDGSCDFAHDDPLTGRARVNVARQRTGLKGCFRLIPREPPTIEALGLPPGIAKATHHHQGLIVVTGPTGHGKTTTLAAIVDLINRETTHHVITVEDPVEYVHPRKRAMMSQREVGTHTKTFRSALKGSLREDPDVIVVGELRDTETMAMALSASETGHLVIGTMNTPSAAKTIDRIIDLFPPGDQQQVRTTLAGALKLVVGQRLVPSVDGRGVHAAVELLPGTVALWNLIREEKTYQIPSLQQRGKSLGIVRLDDSLAELVRSKKVSQEAASAFAESPETFAAALRSGQAVPVAAPSPPSAAATKAASPADKAGLLDRAGALFGRKGGG
jgi:twitching motility protein PilT